MKAVAGILLPSRSTVLASFLKIEIILIIRLAGLKVSVLEWEERKAEPAGLRGKLTLSLGVAGGNGFQK